MSVRYSDRLERAAITIYAGLLAAGNSYREMPEDAVSKAARVLAEIDKRSAGHHWVCDQDETYCKNCPVSLGEFNNSCRGPLPCKGKS